MRSCTVSDEKLLLRVCQTGPYRVLARNTLIHKDVTGNSFRCQHQTWLFDQTDYLVWQLQIPNAISQVTSMMRPTAFNAFKKVRHTHLSICLGPFAGIAWGLLEKMQHWPELFFAVRESRVKSGNDWPTLLDEVWNCESCSPHTPLFFNTSSIWLNGSKTFQ